MFKQVVYHPDESQLLTTGSDRKVTYWDCYDGQAIRMLDGSDSGEINALAITREGEHFVSGGEDKLVKLWDYDEGISYYTGVGHSGSITRVTSLSYLTLFIDRYLTRPEGDSKCRSRRRHLHLAHPRKCVRIKA
jgi:WD40 repeat protein